MRISFIPKINYFSLKDMESKYLQQLPVQAQKLVEEIENFAKLEIQMGPNPHPISKTDPNPDATALHVTEKEAVILLRNLDDFPLQGVTHELLHLHRYWNQQIPQLVPHNDPSDQNFAVTVAIENALEHLIIVPHEADYGFEPYEYWNQTQEKNWNRYPWAENINTWSRRMNCLIGWLSVNNLVTRDKLKLSVQAAIKKEGYWNEVEKYSAKIRKLLTSKVQCLTTTTRFLKIPNEDVRLLYFDVKKRERNYTNLPLHTH